MKLLLQCPECLIVLPEKDFYGRSRCYKCIYKEKEANLKIKKTVIRPCLICGKEIPRRRTRFCSSVCQKSYDSTRNKNVWWKKITIVKLIKFGGSS